MNISKIIVLATALSLSACGGGGGSTDTGSNNGGSTELTGTFIDSAVSGMRYETSSGLKGTTDTNGAYQYKTGDTVMFYIGDLLIGSATATGVLTPISLVPNALDESNTLVINIARFLQSLDMDSNPINGIVISSTVAAEATKAVAAGTTLDFTANGQTVFDNNANALVVMLRTAAYGDSQPLVSVTAAQAHLRTTLLQARNGFYAGSYSEIGATGGTWAIEIKMDGTVTGCLDSQPAAMITGSVSTSGVAKTVAGNTSTGATFTGDFSLEGTVTGTWVNINIADPGNGSYSGAKTSTAPSCSIAA